MKNVLFTFDLEEFDVPREFDLEISEKEMYETSKKGLFEILWILEKHQIKSTFFTTAHFAKKYPEIIKKISKEGHEIASHGYRHSDNYLQNLCKIALAKIELEKIIKKKVKGFRAPRFQIKDIKKISSFGFKYDSSTHPTIAPGKYLRINQNRKIHKKGEVVEIPLSTLPLFPFLRAPINWYLFRHFPKIYRNTHARLNFLFSNYLMLIFHPWEFVDISEWKIPKIFKNKSGKKLISFLEEYILFCKKQEYVFSTIEDYLKDINL